ncbi:MAG: class II aldolase/adducin family protein [Burkholderiaceae bacterium]|nr:class II aldolase/adducin family protein [Microbacteriaceae bacterium]
MTTQWLPDLVGDELVALTRSLGEPAKDLVILAEGNVSERLPDGRLVIKTSGANMATSVPEEFVVVDVDPLTELLLAGSTSQADVTAALDAGDHGGARRRASIETLIHVAVQHIQPSRFVAHTHPTPIVSLLASVHAATAFEEWVYSDEAVVIGRPLFVPYAEPGIALGRLFLERLRGYVDEHDELPSLVLLGNHGLVAIAATAQGAEAITLMAVKGARVRLGALSVGGVAGLGSDVVAKYFQREDMVERRRQLSGTP